MITHKGTVQYMTKHPDRKEYWVSVKYAGKERKVKVLAFSEIGAEFKALDEIARIEKCDYRKIGDIVYTTGEIKATQIDCGKRTF